MSWAAAVAEARPSPLVALRGVRAVREGRIVLGPIDLRLAPGDRVAVMGPNGAGKTTLARILAGVERPDRGEAARARSLCVGYAPQDAAASLLPWWTVRRHLVAALGAAGASRRQAARRTDAWLDEQAPLLPSFDLHALASRRPEGLSGGEAQMASLCRALVARPRLIVLDEPFSAMAEAVRPAARSLVLAHATGGTALAIVSHDRRDVVALGAVVMEMPCR